MSLFKGGKELIGYFGVQILTFTALRTAPQSQVLRLFNLFHLDVSETIIIRIFLEENLAVFSALGAQIREQGNQKILVLGKTPMHGVPKKGYK